MTSLAPERWLPVVGHEGQYEVSNAGRVRSVDRIEVNSHGHSRQLRGRVLRDHKLNSGYMQVSIGRGRNRSVHVLVAEAFLGPRPDGLMVCHNDNDPTNNVVANLRYDTQSSNVLDSVDVRSHRQTRKTHCIRGHEFSPHNTIQRASRKGRICRTCRDARNRGQI